MTSIEDLRKKYGDSPKPLRDFKFEAAGHSFDCYMVRHSRSTMKTRAQISLKDGSSVEVDVGLPSEEETRSRRAYFMVSKDKDEILFFESDQHYSDYTECLNAYEGQQISLNDGHARGLAQLERDLQRAEDVLRKAEKAAERADLRLDLSYMTDRKAVLMQEKAAKVSRLRAKIRKSAAGPKKPDKSFLAAIRMNAPIRVQLPAFVNAANSLRAGFVERLGVVPITPQPITVVGLVKSMVVLRP